MSWKIWHKNGEPLADANGKEIEVHSLTYDGEWMGECAVTTDIENEAPIAFEVGDWLEYRGERFTLNYDPGKVKQGRRNAVGDAFKYDAVKWNALSDEMARAEFLDVVLGGDNQMHYTALPDFTFYIETLDDLLDRLQANMDEQTGEGKWKFYSRNWARSKQRGCEKARWEEIYGGKVLADGTSQEGVTDTKIDSTSVSIQNQTVWEGLALVNSQWDVNFVVRNREVAVGTAGLPTRNIFKYGKGNGLYEISQDADTDQKIVTRMRAYGSDKNLPTRYYATLNMEVWATGSNVWRGETGGVLTSVTFATDLKYNNISAYFHTPADGEAGSYKVTVKIGSTSAEARVKQGSSTATSDRCEVVLRSEEGPSTQELETMAQQVEAGERVYFESGVNRANFPDGKKDYATDNLPNNMACERLMLPGFPNESLADWWDRQTDAKKAELNPTGAELRFSERKDRPWIESAEADKIGVKPGSVYFDTEDTKNKIDEIYPTIEEATVGGVRVDTIWKGTAVEDNGVFKEGTDVPGCTVELQEALDFDINDLKDDNFSIVMRTGMCAGRTFKVGGSVKKDGHWVLTLQRVEDGGIWYPYKDFQINEGDEFALTGIEMPKEYVEWASEKLLRYAIAWLVENDHTRYTYSPKVDEIFMARQHDEAKADKTGTLKSLHDTLKEGDLMQFEDTDLGIDGSVTIDKLTIKEEDGKIATYEITLRDDKEVGTLQRMQEQITALKGGNGAGGGGATAAQIKELVASEGGKYFLSKVTPDTAQKAIRFLEGLKIGAESTGCELTAEGRARLLEVIADRLTDSGFKSGASGFGIWKDEEGRSVMEVDRLTVRQTMTLLELAVEKIRSTGGQIVASAANGTLKSVEEDGDNYLLEFDDACQFKAGDLARCQELTGKELRGYWVEVSEVRDGKAVVAKTEFEDGTTPKTGDELVLMGSRTDAGRRNLISIAATEDGQPRIDVMNGVKNKSLDGALRARLGNLDGITDTWFPTDRQPRGDGLYADNAYLRGTFLIENNGKYEDVKTRFEVTDGKIESAVEGVRSDLMEDRGYLDNPTFGEGRKSWTLGMDAVFFTLGSRWIWANGGPLTKKGNGATVTSDGGRTVVKIKNKYILQKRADMNGAPEIKADADGQKEAVPVYLSFMCKVLKAGRLTVEFTGGDDTGFADYEHFKLERDMEAGTDYEKVEASGLWNSTGDFKLSFTGEINVTMLVLSTDRIESLAYTYRTLFEQSEKLVKIAATNFDKDGNVLAESGIMVKASGAGIYAQDAEGNLATIGAYENGVVKLTGNEIQLEGAVTANGNFKIREDGSIEAVNGKFAGEIEADKGSIGGFSIGSGRIGAESTSDGAAGSLSIMGDHIRVGGKNGGVLIGENVIPSTAGDAFTATARVENKAENTQPEPLGTVNYGLVVDVTGGARNYGMISNAALMAPSFVMTRAQLLTIDPDKDTYTMKLSEYNVILLKYDKGNSTDVSLTLPDESEIARQFGLKELPEDFATTVTFRVRPDSRHITLKGIYNHGESLTNYELSSGNSITVLISKADGFRYEILNHSY